jgi:murein DD-endopeptidase MepM/ murein hydrolase activator NlpD
MGVLAMLLSLLLFGVVTAFVPAQQPTAYAASIALQFPWPTGQYHTINGGDTYGCGYHIHADYYAIDFVSQYPTPKNSFGEPVSAVADGSIYVPTPRSDYGNFIIIHHANGFASLYAHLSQVIVSTGQTVVQGQVIGYSGNTGGVPPHLHLTVYQNIAPTDNTPYNDGFSHAYRPEPMSGVSGFGTMGIHDITPPNSNGDGNKNCIAGTGSGNLVSKPPAILGRTLVRAEVSADGIGVTQNNNPVDTRPNIWLERWIGTSYQGVIGIRSTYSPKTGTFIGIADLGTGLTLTTYTVKLKLSNTLKSQVNNVVMTNGAYITLPSTNLLGGDADGNNVIDAIDYNTFLRSYGKSDPAADFDKSGKVDAVDYNIILRNYNKKGA